MWDAYTWIFVCSIALAFFVAWGIGANDVSNAFGTTVGAKALTLKQVIIVASIMEFGGAVLLGSGVTDTIKSGIAKTSSYTFTPELLMYGMLVALLTAGLWLALATFLELPVSTTHTIVGSIIGFSMVAAGANSVVWYSAPSGGSPFPGGVVSIVLAWFITPVMAAFVAALLFNFTKLFVLTAQEPFKRALMLFPIYTFLTVWIVTYFVVQKGVNGWMKNHVYKSGECPLGASSAPKNYKTDKSTGETTVTGCTIPDGTNAWISAVVASVFTIACLIGLKYVAKLVERDMAAYEKAEAEHAARLEAKAAGIVEEGKAEHGAVADAGTAAPDAATAAEPQPRKRSGFGNFMASAGAAVAAPFRHGANVDIHEVTETNDKIRRMHASAEVFDLKSELTFRYLQILTACTNSFAHGANDVAVPIWMFFIGGIGLVAGVSTYGYKIMRALGVKMTKLTNSRGYCAELTAAIIVIVASRYGFPVSTTQVITGAITGIGISEVISAKMKKKANAGQSFNWLLLLKFFAGWVATLVISGLTAAAFVAQGIYAPSKNAVNYRADFNDQFNTTNAGIAKTLNAAGNVPNPTPAQAQALAWSKALYRAILDVSLSNNQTLLDPSSFLSIFQAGTWYLGNSTQAGVLNNAYMPTMPLIYSEHGLYFT